MAKKERNTASKAWLERMNPLKGVSITEAIGIFDAARNGDTQRLHWLFQEIESANPTLLTCVERRAAALSGLGWRVTGDDEAQRDAVNDFLDGIENFTETVEHLDLAFFRGFAHAQPIWEKDGSVRTVSLLDSWRFFEKDGRTWYCPDCTGDVSASTDCAAARLITVRRRRPIDFPALSIHIRSAVGERDWGRFLERYALPKPAVIMAPNATNEQRNDYLRAASDMENGQASVWPSGTSITDFAGGSRGTDPFNSFIEHQEKLIVLLSTGGTLTSLAQADTGSLAGGAQMDVWREIIARDAAVISGAFQRDLVRPFLEAKFPGRRISAKFEFDFEKKPTPKEVADLAVSLKSAGYTVDQAQLEEKTGLKLVKDVSPAAMSGLAFNKATSDAPNSPNATQKENSGSGATILEAFAKDTGAAAEAVAKLLENPSPEAAAALLEDLPSLLPDDPELATVIAEAMAAEFGSVALANTDQVPAGHSNAGQFTGKTNQPRGKEPETKPQHDRYGSTDTDKLTSEPKKNAERGAEAVEEVMRKKSGYVDKAMFRPEVGWIRFDYGWEGDPHPLKEDDGKGHKKGDTYVGGHGLSHIAAKHKDDFKYLPSVIANGIAFRHPHDPTKTYFVHGDRFACVASLHKGAKKTITEYEPGSKAIEAIKKYPRAQAPGN